MMAMLMILSFAASMIAVPNANAQTDRVTFPFVDAIPRIAGVGQPVLINWGLLNYLNVDGDGWNVTLQIVHPNGKVVNETAMTWSTGTVGRKMTFMEEGNYTLRCYFDRVQYRTVWYGSSVSENVTLQVLAGYWKPDHPGHTLPEEYWTRPVDSHLREWHTIMGSWVRGSSATIQGTELYTMASHNNDAPESAHILWSMPVGDTMGGVAGGDNQVAFQMGDAYEGRFGGSVIVAGVLYYNSGGSFTQAASVAGTVAGSGGSHVRNTVVAVDLHTGKTLWERTFNFGTNNDARISHGQVLTWICLNNRGAFAYLWIGTSGTMYAVEPKTGVLAYNMTNVPAGNIYFGPNGEMLKYRAYNYGTAASPSWYLQQWNSSYVVNRGKISMAESWGSQVQGTVYDAEARGWDMNVSLSGVSFIPGQNANPTGANAAVTPLIAFPCDRVIFGNISNAGVELSGFSLDEENPGYSLFSRRQWSGTKEWQELRGQSGTQSNWVCYSDDPYVAVYWMKENRVNYVFSLENGRFMYETQPQVYADAWTDSPRFEKVIAYGKLYEASCGGIVYCYDAKTGERLWTYEAQDKYNESYLTENWWLIITFITDDKVYLGHMAHSPQEPKPRGAPFFALNATDGTLIWEIDGAFRQTRWGGRAIIGDSIIATMDTYDSQIYAIGKGPSVMTVSAPNTAVTAGTTALISGTVMDNSPGTQSDNAQLRFANGVPAVSEESMSEWMLYVYKQFPRPMGATGVEVTVFAQQGDHVIDVGKTVSNANGRYSIDWTPPADATGKWDIYAYFSGSASYYGTFAQTEMAVSAAPDVVEPVQLPPYGWYILGAAIAIIITVIIVGLLNYKKK